MDLANMSSLVIVEAMNRKDAKDPDAIKVELPNIAKEVDWVTESISTVGRLIYVGDGISGRLGVLDAANRPTISGVYYNTVVGLIADSNSSLLKAKEVAADKYEFGKIDHYDIRYRKKATLVTFPARIRTPYCLDSLKYERLICCKIASIFCNKSTKLVDAAELVIKVPYVPEVSTCSTRLKTGTFQKYIPNMIFTVNIVCTVHFYKNFVVDVKQSNEKLVQCACRLVYDAVTMGLR
ncbi:MAG: N-acetylmuramic acid 6-phosphate etherase [Eggerthellaceae bacterium]|nr:N-acetylmuramic acid 6-phosphate etherase [Eggerthellaceae bacterium]